LLLCLYWFLHQQLKNSYGQTSCHNK
jgi:hypothetical protein